MFKRLVILALLGLVYGCSHPLEIQGQGDIATLSGNSICKLEEQPCANWVAGEYKETYVPVPREGWKFVGWEGCSSQGLTCSFNVPKVPRKFWLKTVGALKAKFSLKDDGLSYSTGLYAYDDLNFYHDRERNHIFISDRQGKSIYSVDNNSLVALKVLDTTSEIYSPWRMAPSPDEKYLYFALLKQDFSSSRSLDEQGGQIGRFDLDVNFFGSPVSSSYRRFDINIDPYDMVVVEPLPEIGDFDNHNIVVSSGSGDGESFDQYLSLYSVNPFFYGSYQGAYSSPRMLELSVEAEGKWVLTTSESDLSFKDVFEVQSGVTTRLIASELGSFFPPNNEYQIYRDGNVFSFPDDSFLTDLTTGSVEINSILFDEVNDNFIVAYTNDPENRNLHVFDLVTFEFVREIPNTQNVIKLTEHNSKVFGLYNYAPGSGEEVRVEEIGYLPE